MADWRLFSKPWSERPSWSRWSDITSIGLTAAVFIIVLWASLVRWMGY